MPLRLFLIVLLSWMIFSTPAPAAELAIYYDTNYHPYCYEENGQAKGPYPEIIKAVLARMPEYGIKLTPIPWERGKKLMRHGEGFALMPTSFYGTGRDYLYPYSLPLHREEIIVACRKRVLEKPRPNWPTDYQGLSISNVHGMTPGVEKTWRPW